jgi:drug/metabolite transporter (DMT)-like permease
MNGILLAIAGAAVLAFSDATSKWLATHYPIGQIVFARGVFSVPVILLVASLGGGMRMLRIVNLRGQLFRAGLDAGSTFMLVLGLALLPFVDVTIIMSAGPLFVAALAGLVLGERVGWQRWLAVVCGFAGVMVIISPSGGGGVRWELLIPLGATVLGAMRDLWTRRLQVTETAVGTLAAATLAVTLTGLLTLPYGWRLPTPIDLALMALAGVLLAVSQYLFIEAFRRSEATRVAPMKYTTIVWATGIGVIVWGEQPGFYTVLGAALIVVSGYHLIRSGSGRVPGR